MALQLQQALYQRQAGKPGEAERTAAAVLRDDSMHAQALYVRGMCLYDRVGGWCLDSRTGESSRWLPAAE